MLASRAAGLGLAKIMAFLLFPVIYFGFVIGSEFWREDKQVRASANGLLLFDLVYPATLDVVQGWSGSGRNARLAKEGPALASALGVDRELGVVMASLTRDLDNHQSLMSAVAVLAASTGAANGLEGRGSKEANRLASLAASGFPQLIGDFNALYRQAANASFTPQLQGAEVNSLILSTGRLEQSAKAFADSVAEARAISPEGGSYRGLQQAASRIEDDAQHLKGLLLNNSSEAGSKIRLLASDLNPLSQKFAENASSAWSGISARISNLDFERSSELQSRAIRTLLVSLSAVLLGIGSAVAMFRSTLRKLDEVELARKDATLAREEAERSSAELSGLNADITRMNGEMAQNLKMLRAAQDQLLKKGRMEQMGQLTATIAHELRNPLGAVRTSAFLMERKTKDKGLGIEGQLQRINNGIQRCDDIITQLLDFSRSKNVVTTMEDLDGWLENVVNEDAQRLPPTISVSCTLGLGGKQVPIDPSRLHRAITNLLNNASEAMVGQGDDPARKLVAHPEIRIVTRVEADKAVIEIADNGPGITAENISRVKEPLFTTKSFGTGLGLPAVDQIVVQHGGTLALASEPGEGAIFTIRLPLTKIDEIAA